MASTFPMRTGNVSYHIGLSVPAITGSWSVSLGFFGLNENSWSISGMSGKLYNNSGYAISSYNSTTSTTLEGVISGAEHTIYQDGILLTNVGEQEVNDYNMVSVSGNYLGGYLPSVNIRGDSKQTDEFVQTVPFWNKRNDDNLLFVTENATADLGFIQCVSGMGFNVTTGLLTGFVDSSLTENYGLIIFGAATNSGSYTRGNWNSLGVPKMSLNSHLVCPENLNWYGGLTSLGIGEKTGVVFPERYFSPTGRTAIWAEFPIQGWQKLVHRPDPALPNISNYVPDGFTGDTLDPGYLALFSYSAPNTTIYLTEKQGGVQYTTNTVVAGDIAPDNFATALQQDYSLTFTDIPDATAVTTVLSNTLGGTGAPADDLTGSQWGLGQIWNQNRVIPQRASYDANVVYRRSTLTTGLYPTDQFHMYTGDISVSQGFGGDTFVSNMDTGKLITAWHKGFWTGDLLNGGFTVPELLVFSVTPIETAWSGGYDMWGTLTQTGKQLFVNSVMEFFIH